MTRVGGPAVFSIDPWGNHMTPTPHLERDNTGLARRTLVKGAAWSVPAVAVAAAAPALAHSGPCTPFDVGATWQSSSYRRSNNGSATYTRNVTNPVNGTEMPVVVTLSSSLTGSTQYGYESSSVSDNLRLSTFNIGGTGAPGITMHQYLTSHSGGSGQDTSAWRRTNYQSLTFTFNVPVYDLSFGITDIDSNSGDFYDHVELVSTSAWTATTGNQVTGTGLNAANAWRNTSGDRSADNSSGVGNANITFSEAVTSFTIIYWDNRTSTTWGMDNDQKIFITNLSFKVSGCDWATP